MAGIGLEKTFEIAEAKKKKKNCRLEILLHSDLYPAYILASRTVYTFILSVSDE